TFGFSTRVPATPVTLTALVPDIFLGAFKISENESPRPDDRAFVYYNYYRNVRLPIENGGVFPITLGSFTGSGQLAASHLDINREVIGFEKTFLGGDASIGLRLPILQTTGGNFGVQGLVPPASPTPLLGISATATLDGDSGIGGGHVGDLSVVLKYALLS